MNRSEEQAREAAADAVIEDVYPLSPLQQGMLFHSLYHPGAGFDFEQIVVTLPEAVDGDRLRRAWLQVAERHPALRAAFRWDDGEPRQEVHAGAVPAWHEQDWRRLPRLDGDERLEQFLREDRQRGV